jgi:protein-disulfide isomerase
VTRERRLWLLAGAAVVATVIVAVAIAISQGGADNDDEPSPAPRSEAPGSAGPEQAAGVFEDIPQDGVSLGDPNAPATLIEFADLQCPFCAEFAEDELPGVIDPYVRSGELRVELRLLAFIGPDSERARQVAHAAALQDRMWDYTELFFRNQGPENSGYATDAFLQRIARQTPGLDVEQLAEDYAGPQAEALTRHAEQFSQRLEVSGTPAFYLFRDGRRPEPIEIDALGEALEGG